MADEAAGITQAVASLLPWLQDEQRFPPAWVSAVCRSEGNGVVVLTGARTTFGRTTGRVQRARPKLHIEAVVGRVIRWLFGIVATLIALVTAVSLLRGIPLLQMAPLMLVLLMAALPVALPVMFTFSMALGARELARRGVLVTRLSAVEDAATMTVLCADKTGTITPNQLAVIKVAPRPGVGSQSCTPKTSSRWCATSKARARWPSWSWARP